jgi:hypothetical protein
MEQLNDRCLILQKNAQEKSKEELLISDQILKPKKRLPAVY